MGYREETERDRWIALDQRERKKEGP